MAQNKESLEADKKDSHELNFVVNKWSLSLFWVQQNFVVCYHVKDLEIIII